MNRWLRACCAAAVVTAGGAAPVGAQQGDGFPPEYPRWDVSGGLGIHYLDHHELSANESWWEAKAQTRVQIGRYLTPHLKAEVAVSLPATYELYENTRLEAPGLPGGIWTYTTRTLKLVTLSPAFTWQFFENTFAHPFLSAGVDVNVGDDQTHRDASTVVVNRVSYPVPAVGTRRTLVFARPFFAAGFKSYFNDWTFVRPEAHMSFNQAGASQVSLRLDVGIDF